MKRKIESLFESNSGNKSLDGSPVSTGLLKAVLNRDNWPGVPMYDVPVTASALVVVRDEPAAEPAYFLILDISLSRSRQ
ncbi:hypothetical protein [Chitinophaga costaii]|uniref:hypothetical protein n=1 Tax=Chitinophaga costaii TaxID=1335309 RepID=UPI000F4DFEB5|nr:hypothetical protein [Chitinophaga costaii]